MARRRFAMTAAALMILTCAIPHVAAAQDFDIHIGGPDRGPPPDYPPPPDYGDDEEGGPPPPPRHGRGCDPDDAEDEARDMGLRHAHVVDVTPRRVIVEGFGRHGPEQIVFANVGGCPLIGRD